MSCLVGLKWDPGPQAYRLTTRYTQAPQMPPPLFWEDFVDTAPFFPGQSPEATGILLHRATLPVCRDCLPPRIVLSVEPVLC